MRGNFGKIALPIFYGRKSSPKVALEMGNARKNINVGERTILPVVFKAI